MLQNGDVVVGDPPTSSNALAEIGQTKNLKFAFLCKGETEGVFTPFHPLVKCRDFLNDILESKARGEGFYLYGLEMSAEENKLDDSCLRFVVRFGNEEDTQHFIDNFGFILNQEQKYFNVSPSKLFRVKNKPTQLMIEADKYWQSATFLVSLYSYMCRCVMYMKSPDDNWFGMANRGIDGQYMHQLKELGFEKNVAFLKDINLKGSPSPSGFNPEEYNVEDVHDEGGIIRLMSRAKYDAKGNYYAEQLVKLCA